jgi:nicotinate-nucleotide pyrophosphorylase (carboxylating)
MLEAKSINPMVEASLKEDVGSGDISAALLKPAMLAKASIISRENAVICGKAWVDEVFKQVDSNVHLDWNVTDGDHVPAGHHLVTIIGCARSILTAERCALNWLQTLSGTATITAQYVEKLQGLNVKLLDTRKTIPGLRYAQKYAVRCGGGYNHRMGLFDAYLIKENHIISAGSVEAAISQARMHQPRTKIEIEVENLTELKQAISAKADIILLDNFNLNDMSEAVRITQKQAELEVSGNVDLNTIRQIAETGVDRISVGALTKHIQAIDLSLRFQTFHNQQFPVGIASWF